VLDNSIAYLTMSHHEDTGLAKIVWQQHTTKLSTAQWNIEESNQTGVYCGSTTKKL